MAVASAALPLPVSTSPATSLVEAAASTKADTEAPVTSTPSWLEWIAGDSYTSAWQAIIRPLRCRYSVEDLGPSRFCVNSRHYERHDLELSNLNGQQLKCSHFVPASGNETRHPCVVYLHGNSSSRLEVFDVLPVVLQRKLSVFCFDFSGSGESGGEFVSLGHQEEKDLVVILRHLRKLGTVSSIGLWGRSMGAATAILRASKDHCLGACVLDSPFAQLRTVAEELVTSRLSVPQFVVDMGIEVVRGEVSTRAGFDLEEIHPIRAAPKARCPALFAAAHGDQLVLPHHAQDLHDVWGGERRLRTFGGDHNDERPSWFIEEAADFLAEHLCCRNSELRAVPLQKDQAAGQGSPPVPKRASRRSPAPKRALRRTGKAVTIDPRTADAPDEVKRVCRGPMRRTAKQVFLKTMERVKGSFTSRRSASHRPLQSGASVAALPAGRSAPPPRRRR